MPRDWKKNRQDHADPVDPKPMAIYPGDRKISMKDEIMAQVRQLIQQEKEEELESLEEFWDLDIDEDKDFLESAYELDDMVEEYYSEPLEAPESPEGAEAQVAPDQAETQPEEPKQSASG